MKMRFKVGQHAKLGDILAFSKRGNLRPMRAGDQAAVGVALEPLRRGKLAECDVKDSAFYEVK